MKSKSTMRGMWSVVIIITMLMCILPIEAKTTGTPKIKEVEVDGAWVPGARSVVTNCPITVFTDGYLLTIQNASPDRDMTIRITDVAKGTIVYENNILEAQSANITVSIASLSAGEYKLEIIGTPSGYLKGNFTQE